MSINQILDITIVVFATYALLSTLCSYIYEFIAARLALRGWGLFRGISQLVGGDAIAAQIFNHPLVNATSRDPDKTMSDGTITGMARFMDVLKSAPPSYLDARNFSSAFWQLIHTSAAARQASANVAAAAPSANETPIPPATTEFAQLATLLDPNTALQHLQKSVNAWPNNDLRKSMLGLLSAAQGDYEKLLKATDGWFNAQMDRVSGWYKRRAKTVMFFIALIVVSIAGIDSVSEFKVLSATDPCVLQKIAADAALLTKDEAAKAVSVPCTADAIAQNEPATFDVTRFARVNVRVWENWGPSVESPQSVADWLWGARAHAPGMALTWLAVWLGGPFWFEALCSLANIRSAGRKPQREDQPPQ